jgi:hypothetical protein
MKKVIVPQPKNDSLIAQLAALYKTFKDIPPKESLEFDLSNLSWFCPLIVLPLSAYIDTTNSKHIKSQNQSYLDTIKFPHGVDSISSFEQQIQRYKTFIPISVLRREKGQERERLESLFIGMVYKIIGSVPGAQNAVYYPLAELITNIFDHSKQNVGFIFGQFYPKKNYLDICIVDRGRGLSGAYKQEKNLILSDENAIKEVMQGNSTKPNNERGYGVRTSQKVVCEGLGGDFMMISGEAALISANKNEKLVSLKDFYWQGVIIAYRIPKPAGSIDISKYLE